MTADPQAQTDVRSLTGAYVEEHRPALVAAACKLLGDRDEAEDLVQETILACLVRLDGESPQHLEAYIWKAVRNNAIKYRARRRCNQSLNSIGFDTPQPTGDDPWDSISPEQLEQALVGLPINQQAVIRMKYYLNMSFMQIGLALAVSSNTVASRCRYGLKNLRKTLKIKEILDD